MTTVGKKMAVGAIWMVFMRFTAKGLGLISTMVLARLLVPEDFGLVAMAMSIYALIDLLNSFNFDVVLIQKQDSTDKHYNTAWTFNVLFGAFSALILALLAIPTALFYNEARLEQIIYLLALGAFLQGFENIGIVQFRKELNFSKEFNFQVTKKMVSFFVTIPIAYLYHTYWALIIGIVSGQLFGVILSYLFHKYRPKFSLEAKSELFHFSKWLFINNLLYFSRFRFADFVVGRYTEAKYLGLYTVAYEISSLPTTELVAPINRAIFPGYSKMAGDLQALKKGFLDVIAVIALCAIPAGVGIALVSNSLVILFLGPNWTDAAPLIEILALFGVLVALQTNISAVFLSLGKPKIIVALSFGHAVFIIPALIIAVKNYHLIGAAWAYLISMILFLPINYFFVFKELKISFPEYFSRVWRSFFAAFMMIITLRSFNYFIENQWLFDNVYIHLLIKITAGAIVYVCSVSALWVSFGKPNGAETFIFDKIIERRKIRK